MCKVPYASAVESLICYDVYKHDICYAIGLVTRYQSDPGQAHWKTVKRIQVSRKHYLSCYQGKDLHLKSYTNVDWEEI